MTLLSGQVPLRSIASARAGDKGNISNVAVWTYDPRNYPAIRAQLTADRVAAAFGALLTGDVRRYTLDHLHGLNFVLDGALEGGVNDSLNLDAHGKSFSFLLLDLIIDLDAVPSNAAPAQDPNF